MYGRRVVRHGVREFCQSQPCTRARLRGHSWTGSLFRVLGGTYNPVVKSESFDTLFMFSKLLNTVILRLICGSTSLLQDLTDVEDIVDDCIDTVEDALEYIDRHHRDIPHRLVDALDTCVDVLAANDPQVGRWYERRKRKRPRRVADRDA